MSKEGQEAYARFLQTQAGKGPAAAPAPAPEPGIVSKVIAGAGQDLKSMLYIPAGVSQLVKPLLPWRSEKPSEVYPEVIRGMGQYYAGYKDPLKMIEEHPVNTLLDVAGVVSLGGGALVRGAGAAGKAGLISAERAAQLGRIGTLAKTPLASAVTGPARKLARIAEAEVEAGKTWKQMSTAGRVGARLKGLQAQGDITALRNMDTAKRWQTFGKDVNQLKELAPEIEKLSPDEQALGVQYLEISRSRLERTPQGRLVLDAIENPASPTYNSRLAKSVQAIKQFSREDLEAELAREGSKFTEEGAKIRVVEPMAIEDLRQTIPDFDKLPQAQRRMLISDRAQQILSIEKVDNLGYLHHRNLAAELRGQGHWTMGIPTLDFLKKSYLPGFLKSFQAGEQAPINLAENVLRRRFMRRAFEANLELSDEIARRYGKKLSPGEYVRPGEVSYNPNIDVWRTRAAQNAYRYMAKHADRLSDLHESRITGVVETIFDKLKTIMDHPEALSKEAALSHPIMRDIGRGMADLMEIDPELARTALEGLEPTLKGFLSESLKGTAEGQVTALRKFMDKNPSYRIPRVVKQVMDRSSTFDEYSKLLRPLVDRPLDIWRFGVLGSSPRWMLYNLLGNVTQHVLHGTNPAAFVEALKVKGGQYKGVELPPVLAQTMGKVEGSLPSVNKWYGLLKPQPDLKTFAVKGLREFQTVAPSHWQRVMGAIGGGLKKSLGVIVNANSRMEEYFWTAMYLDEAKKMAIRTRVNKVGYMGAILDQAGTKEVMLKLLKDPAATGQMLKAVDDFMFNYGNLSPLERNVFRRVVPFYSWYKNMFRLILVTLPGKYPIRADALFKFAEMGRQAWTQDMQEMGIDVNMLPDWMRGAIPVGYDPKTRQLTYWNTQGPNIFQTVSVPNMLSALNPMIKVPLERLLHRDIFKDQKFTAPWIAADYRGKLWDLRTGRETSGVNPSLPEHIFRQVPWYQALREMMNYRRFGYVPLEYGTASLWNPQPITIKGEPQLKRGLAFTTLPKLGGVSLGQMTVKDQQSVGRAKKMGLGKASKQTKEFEKFQTKYKKGKP